MIWGGTQQKCPCSSGSSLGLDWGCHCARQLAPVHAHLLRDLIALHMECLLLTLSGMVKPSTIPSHAHVRLLQPGRGKKKKNVSRPHAAPRGRKGEGARRPRAPISGAARWAAGAVYFYPSLSRSSRPPHPCCRRAPSPRPDPHLSRSLCHFSFRFHGSPAIALPLQRAQAAASYPLFFHLRPPLHGSSRLPGLGFCRKKGTRNPTTAAAVESGTGRGKAGMRMKRGAE